MADINSTLSSLHKFILSLSWKRLAQFTVFMLILMLGFVTFEARDIIYNFASYSKLSNSSPALRQLSKETRFALDQAVIKSDIIVGLQVTLVDFQKNTRIGIYSTIDDPGLNELYHKFTSGSLTELPLFNSNVVNNRRLVDLINGEFICDSYQDTITAKLVVGSPGYIHTVCSTGIPPHYGKFIGVVCIWIKRELTRDEIDQIRVLSRNLSEIIYEKEFSK